MFKNSTRTKCLWVSGILLALSVCANAQQWSIEKANEWADGKPWFCGVNYIPAYAINYTAMWDPSTFSPRQIDEEMCLMEECGLNCARVVLQYAVYAENPKRFKRYFRTFLDICDRHGVMVMPIFFDPVACGANTDPKPGPQGEPLEGWYGWAWSPSPGYSMTFDERTHPLLEKFVKDVMTTFKDDGRIMAWDLYNEPVHYAQNGQSEWPLLRSVFRWAREVNPSQPVTSSIWNGNEDLNRFLSENSDIITFHIYAPAEATLDMFQRMKAYGRPVILTEWMHRVNGSTIKDVLPALKDEDCDCMMWGLVNGKNQTHLPWGHRPEMGPYTGPWQHDIFRGDRTPYDPEEIRILKRATAEKNGYVHSAKVKKSWVKYEGNPVLGNAELGTCFDVNVISEGTARYNMYFSWRPKKAIALSRSDDGINWTDPEIVLEYDSTSGWEDDLNRSCTLFWNGKYHMWYTGQARDSSRIGYAVSEDGVHFERVVTHPVLEPETGFEGFSVMNPYVLRDEERGVFRMWYSAGETIEPNVLCYAESKDGVHWERSPLNPIFVHGEAGEWDQDRIGGCEVHRLDDGSYALFYIGYTDINTARIGVAISQDGITGWKRLESNPLVEPDPDSWDGDACYKPSVALDRAKKRWLLWYNGRKGCNEYIGLVIHKGVKF